MTSSAPPPPAKKKLSGCLLALLVVGAMFAFGCVAIGIGLVVFLRSDTGKKVAGAVGEGFKMTVAARSAPGARAIEAAGCSEGMVFDVERSWAVVHAFVGDGGQEAPELVFRTMINCSVNVWHAPPPCESVKEAYLAAVPKPGAPFIVQVKSALEPRARCMKGYDVDGTFMQDFGDAGGR